MRFPLRVKCLACLASLGHGPCSTSTIKGRLPSVFYFSSSIFLLPHPTPYRLLTWIPYPPSEAFFQTPLGIHASSALPAFLHLQCLRLTILLALHTSAFLTINLQSQALGAQYAIRFLLLHCPRFAVVVMPINRFPILRLSLS